MDLMKQGIKAAAYHAYMDPGDRESVHSNWLRGRIQVICATIGMLWCAWWGRNGCGFRRRWKRLHHVRNHWHVWPALIWVNSKKCEIGATISELSSCAQLWACLCGLAVDVIGFRWV